MTRSWVGPDYYSCVTRFICFSQRISACPFPGGQGSSSIHPASSEWSSTTRWARPARRS